MKIHSREWFLQQIAETKSGIAEQWPSWMKEGKAVAVASFPRVGEDNQKKVAENYTKAHSRRK